MAKKLQTPSQAYMQRERYCLAVHKNTCERIFEYAGAEKQTADKSDFIIFFFLLSHTLDWHSLQTKAVIELLHAQNDIVLIVVAPFSPFVCKLARMVVLASCSSAKL